MATLTIRNLPVSVVRSLKARAKRNHRSMEQEARELITNNLRDRAWAIEQIEKSWARQSRRTTPEEIEAGIKEGRE